MRLKFSVTKFQKSMLTPKIFFKRLSVREAVKKDPHENISG